MMEASAKTTVARKVEKAPWKTWGPVLVEIEKFHIKVDVGALEKNRAKPPGGVGRFLSGGEFLRHSFDCTTLHFAIHPTHQLRGQRF